MLQLSYPILVNPSHLPSLSAEQLWTGLLLRVMEPVRFTVGLDQADVSQVDELTFQRVLNFGGHEIHDEVQLQHPHSVQFTTVANERVPEGRLRYEIQNHAEQGLILLCEYHTAFPEPDTDESKQLLEMVKNAYRMADEEMLRIIREDALVARH
jgi:hypothetical protein